MSATLLAALRAREKRRRHERAVIEQMLCTQAEWSAAWGQLLREAVRAELRRDE